LSGRFDAKADRKASVLRVNAIHKDARPRRADFCAQAQADVCDEPGSRGAAHAALDPSPGI
jgi:hypothetical protein